MAGVSSTGFVSKTIADILADVQPAELAAIDPALDLSPNSPIGQLNGIFARKLAELWELGQTAYNGFNPDAAENFLQDALCALTGTLRLAATTSAVTCIINVGAGQTIPAGSIANVVGQPSIRFQTLAPVTNAVGASANFPVFMVAMVNGPVVANAGSLSVITTPVTGWNSVTNPLDATLGTLQETDTAIRLRRQNGLASSGASTPDSIRAALLNVKGVISAFVFENTTLLTDANSVPAKALECVIYDGAAPAALNSDVAAALWNSKPSGIQLYGSTTTTTLDSVGTSRSVSFSRSVPQSAWLEFDLATDTTFPIDGAAQVKAAVVAKGAGKLFQGVSVIAEVYKSAALNIQGVVDVTALRLGFAAAPVGLVNLAVTSRNIAVLDTTRILVNGV